MYILPRMRNKLFLWGVFFILLIAIPLTLYLVQKQQQTQSKASPATVLSLALSIPSQTPTVGQQFDVDLNINPGTNQVTYVKAVINYDATKIATAGAGFIASSLFPTTTEGPTYTAGTITIAVSISADFNSAVKTPGKVGTFTFQPNASTKGVSTQVAWFDQSNSLVYALTSKQNNDNFGDNVLSSITPLKITIADAIVPTPGPTTPPQIPICDALKIDRIASGNTPFSITFTADGHDPDGTISKVSFDFGDGPTQDIATGQGIGTSRSSVPLSHTYNNAGVFVAKTTFIDNQQNASAPSSVCSQTITVAQSPTPTPSAGGRTTTPIPTPTLAPGQPSPTPIVLVVTPTTTPTQIVRVVTPTPIPCSPGQACGPGGTILAVGGIGAALTVVGALLFFGL